MVFRSDYSVTPDSVPEYMLLVGILKGVPKMSDAACKKFPGLHHDDSRRKIAKEICFSCPCLQECEDWVANMNTMERKLLSGIWAGRYRGKP
jgi:hypothetical protein